MSEVETIHVHKPKFKHRYYYFFVIIPVFVFFALFFVYSRIVLPQEAARMERENRVKASEEERSAKEISLGDTKITAMVAETEEQRRVGLSHRESLDENSAMLFIFENENVRPAFWMKNMKFPIDIIWINDGEIIQIDREVLPPEDGALEDSLPLYLPNGDTDYVVEVNAGWSDRMNVSVGDSFTIH